LGPLETQRIIVALDVETATEAMEQVQRIGAAVDFYKVGMELYAAAGMDIVHRLRDAGKRVFLDMKYYDISETVKRATAQVARHGIDLLTVHGSNAVMRAALEGRGTASLRLLAITVLTSYDESDLQQMGYPCSPSELVELRVRNAAACGMDGIVCSPLEAAKVRAQMGTNAIIVTPGVRSAGAGSGDQKRVATPAEAIRAGASYLVIGRQITRHENPGDEARRVQDEIASALN
jgi:orotidine-5'-phosphate decarboxylase